MTVNATITKTTFDVRDYQAWTRTTAIYKDADTGNVGELMYLALGLTGEAGEMANYTKKLYRDGDSAELRATLVKELGDVLWYAARTANALGTTLDAVMAENRSKIESRQQRNKLSGSGDNR